MRTTVGVSGIFAAFLMLVACTSQLDGSPLTLEELGAESVLEPFIPTPDYEEIGPGVWRLHYVDPQSGAESEHIHANNAAGLAFLATVYYPHRISELEVLIEQSSSTSQARILADQKAVMERFIAQQSNFVGAEPNGAEKALRACTASAAASATSTTGGPGAKAYANAKNCSGLNDGGADTYAFAGGNEDEDARTAYGIGGTASASSAAYGLVGTDCYSRGSALGYPDAWDQKFYSAKC